MKTSKAVILLCILFNTGSLFSQCHTWKITWSDFTSIDSISFDTLIYSDYLPSNYLVNEVELKLDSAIQEFLIPIPKDLRSTYGKYRGLVALDSVEYAFYDADTIKIKGKKYKVYNISTNLYSEWNEDFTRWYFYYSKEFGIFGIEYYEFSGAGALTAYTLYLVDDCGLTSKQKEILEILEVEVHKLDWN